MQIEIDFLLTERDDKIFYYGNLFQKLFLAISLFYKRILTLRKVKQFQVIFIFREAFIFGGAYFEKLIIKKNPNVIFDFDDAIWINNISEKNKKLKWLKKPEKTMQIFTMSKIIIAGNNYLADYARRYNNNVLVIPTTIDTTYHKPFLLNKNKDIVVIGWTGSSTTLCYFEQLLPVLNKIMMLYKEKVKFKIIVDKEIYYPSICTTTTKWSIQNEIEELAQIDIGIMPLPNNEWAKGKCGFKCLQYMSLEIPAVVSPVGVNTEIVQDGYNGFLASSDNDWIEKLSLLIESTDLRTKIGKNGRKTVEDKYSINANKEKYLKIFLQC
jgi:glycosyltransferase involved in cell wall biosynthesis